MRADTRSSPAGTARVISAGVDMSGEALAEAFTVARMSRRPHPRRALVAAALAASLAFVSAACADTTHIPPAPEGTADAEPLFASDEEALEAATAAYEEYLAASQLAGESGGRDIESLEKVTTSEMFEDELQSLQRLAKNDWVLEGRGTVRSAELQQWFADSEGHAVFLNVCLDVSAVVVRDENGEDVTPADRDNLLPLQIELTESERESSLRVASSELWPGDANCQ